MQGPCMVIGEVDPWFLILLSILLTVPEGKGPEAARTFSA